MENQSSSQHSEQTSINIEEQKYRSIGEEEWSESSEILAKEWADQALETSKDHNQAGKAHKCKHISIGLPAILVPVMMAPISATLADLPGIEYANMAGFLLSGCLSAVHSFFGFEKKYQKHMDYSSRYSDVYTDVKYELTKSRRFRQAPDAFLMKIQMKLDGLGANAPDL